MESKVFIDLDANGAPQIRIDYRFNDNAGDLRDKVLGRFVFDIHYGEVKMVPVLLELGHMHADGMVAFIRQPQTAEALREIIAAAEARLSAIAAAEVSKKE